MTTLPYNAASDPPMWSKSLWS